MNLTILIFFIIALIVVFLTVSIISIYKINNNYKYFSDYTNDNVNSDSIGIYYINMDKSKDRKKHMILQLKKQGLDGIRQKGIDGKKLNLDNHKFFLKNFKDHFRKRPDRIGHLGCFFSHLEIYKKFLNSNKQYCLVLEDDTSFLSNNFKNILNNTINKFSTKRWDIILFGYHIDQDWNKKHKENNRELYLKDNVIHNINYFTGLHCYLINRKTAMKLLEKLKQPNWYIDWEISRLAYNKELIIKGIFPPVVCQPAAFKVNVNDINYRYKCKFFKTTTNKDKYVEPK